MWQFLLLLTVFLTARAMGGRNCTTALTNLTEPFECFNNSTCKAVPHNETELEAYLTIEGITLDIYKEYSRGGYHCSCLKGWTGLRCNTKYETCGTWGNICL